MSRRFVLFTIFAYFSLVYPWYKDNFICISSPVQKYVVSTSKQDSVRDGYSCSIVDDVDLIILVPIGSQDSYCLQVEITHNSLIIIIST